MIDANLLNTLAKFGLSKREAKIYLSLLNHESATANEIAQFSGINRSTTYVVLESLGEKNLIGVSDDRKVRKFRALHPDRILDKAKQTADKHTKIKDEIEKILPELKANYKGSINKPVVRVYEGKEGLWEIYTDVFDSDIKEFRVFEDLSNILKIFPNFIEYDSIQRLKKGINLRSIAPAKKEIMKACLLGIGVNKEELAFIPKEMFKFPVDITIYGNKVSFAAPNDLFGIMIEHKEISAALKAGFDLAFAEAKRLNDEQQIKMSEPNYYFKTPEDKTKLPEMINLLKKSFKDPGKFLESMPKDLES